MSPEDWKRIEALYHTALEHPSGERAALLAQADPDIRRQVEILLAQPSAGSPLDHPAWDGMEAVSAVSQVDVLAPGRKLGNFEIVSLLGRGGMGEVYRARDLRLKREVAIKILPPSFAGDRERVARFEREARAASALNHPNIVSVFDVGAEGGTHWIASELVAGESLQTLIGRGPLAPRKAIEIAAQIAEGLAAAHANGIVHRDLKPGNVMITRDGRAKILDFGLAKQRRTATEADATVTDDLTDTGAIMGTAAYMSPEQVRGEAVDPRSDIFSLGLIVHEMLSGKRAFSGESLVEVMNAILKNDPPELSPAVPPTLARIVGRCLEKEPARRFQSAADLGFALSSVSASPAAAVLAKRRGWLALSLSAAAVSLAAISGWFWGHSGPVKTAEHSLTRLTANGKSFDPAISRDGKMLAYSAAIGGSSPDIWLQQIAGGNAIQITHEKEGANYPSFSPDGTQVAYTSRNAIYEVPALGGDARLITSDGLSSRYTPDGSAIVFLRLSQGWLRPFTIPRMGGTAVAISPDSHLMGPFALSPDGEKVLALAVRDGTEEQDVKRWWAIPIPGGKLKEIDAPGPPTDWQPPLDWVSLDRGSGRQWVIFSRWVGDSNNLFRVPVSSDGKVLSDAEQITFTPGVDFGAAVSGGGRMVFSSGATSKNLWSIPLDTNHARVTGERLRLTQVEGVSDEGVSLSRDGKKAVFVSGGRILVKDLATGHETQLATGGGPSISPDGSFIVYGVTENQKTGLYMVSTMGGTPRRICQDCASLGPKGFSSDGSRVLAQGFVESTLLDRIELIDIASGEVKVVLSDPNHCLWHPYFSWDDKWVTFKMQLDPPGVSTAARHFRIYITPVEDFVPAGESHWIALTSGDYNDDKPQLSPDGNTLYFTSNRDQQDCFWAQRLNPKTKHPEGAPFAIQHLHDQQSFGNPLFSMELNVARDEIVTNLKESRSDIWMTQLAPDK